MPKIQAHIVYKGRVKGVGFRFTIERVALNFGITGWVKNTGDGNVEVVDEAEQEEISNFLDTLRGYFMKHIVDEEISTAEASGKFKDFKIRF